MYHANIIIQNICLIQYMCVEVEIKIDFSAT
jgi:hypothetical protein